MDIQNRIVDNKGYFFVEIDGEKLAELVFRLSPGIMKIDHTEVNEQLKGKNVGYQLVDHAATFARESGLKIKAYCEFAKAVFEKKHDQYSDVILNEKGEI